MSETSNIVVRRLGPDDWELYREVRFAALRESPWAFSSTLTREQQFSEEVWRERLHANCIAVAFRGDDDVPRAVGVVGGYVGEHGPELVSMWVSPDARASGAADALIHEVCGWAAEEGHVTLALWVVESNQLAQRVYVRNGFIRSGRVQQVRVGEETLEYEMIRVVSQRRNDAG
jgi:GNAT superfamily N-acetyltransferase